MRRASSTWCKRKKATVFWKDCKMRWASHAIELNIVIEGLKSVVDRGAVQVKREKDLMEVGIDKQILCMKP